MWARLVNLWDRLRSTFVFVPLLIVAGLMVLGLVMPQIEMRFEKRVPWLVMTPESVQNLLSAIATSMMTVASLVFSIAMVTLSIAMSHLGPRLLRTYTSMRSTQIALGLFVGTGIYSILVLMAVRNQDEGEFVPHLAVILAVLLTLLALVYLVYFVHRVSYLIQAPNAAHAVSHDLDRTIERLYPERFGKSAANLTAEEVKRKLDSMGENYQVVPAPRDGYIESIDTDGLMRLAAKHDLVLLLYHRPGQFVLAESPLVKVWPLERKGLDIPREIRRAFILGNRAMPRQDVECAINELVEVALRALSPSMNDPYTAINCIDRLAASLARLAEREIPSAYRLDEQGNLRMILKPVDFHGALDAAFDQIRQNSTTHVAVQIRLLDALALIARFTHREEDRTAVQLQADMIRTAAERNITEQNDLGDVQERYADVEQTLRQTAHVAQAKPLGV